MKIVRVFAISFFACILAAYAGFCLYVDAQAIAVDETALQQECSVFLTDEQLAVAAAVLTNSRKPQFKRLPLLYDAFSAKNQIAHFAVGIYTHSQKQQRGVTAMKRRFIDLGTRRHIVKNIDYKLCYNYVFSKAYFGNGIYNADTAAQYYFGKTLKDAQKDEFTTLCLLMLNPRAALHSFGQPAAPE